MVAPFLRPDGDLSPEEQRAAISALAGPMRVPFGRTVAIELVVGENAVQISANRTSNATLFVEVRAISSALPVTFIAGSRQELSLQSAPEYDFPTESPARFLLYPGESLFLQATTGGASFVTVNEVRV